MKQLEYDLITYKKTETLSTREEQEIQDSLNKLKYNYRDGGYDIKSDEIVNLKQL